MSKSQSDQLIDADTLRVSFGGQPTRERRSLFPTSLAELQQAIAASGNRGVTCSPDSTWSCDWTANCGGDAVTMTGALASPPVEWIDWERGVARVAGGALIDEIMSELFRHGWCPASLAADPNMTVSAAISANGITANAGGGTDFGSAVIAIELVDASGTFQRLDPVNRSDAFHATVGGLGLTGVIVAAELRIRAIGTVWMSVSNRRADSFDDVVDLLASSTGTLPIYANLDAHAETRDLGRGQVVEGRHAKVSDLPSARVSQALAYEPVTTKDPQRQQTSLSRALRRLRKYHHQTAAPEHTRLVPIPAFFQAHVVGVAEASPWWVRYEVRLPDEHVAIVPSWLSELAHRGIECRRPVLVRSASRDTGWARATLGPSWLFGFSIPADHPMTPRVLDGLDEQVAGCGGHIILASDERTRPELAATMFGQLANWRAQRQLIDPEGRFQSNLSRRLDL